MNGPSSMNSDDDVRRSIDVLDKVLSEFDDIDGFYSSEQSSQESQHSDSEQQKGDSLPPPIDRSLKPRSSPPTLPKKTKKKSLDSLPEIHEDNKVPVTSPSLSSPTSTTNTHRSHKSKRSEDSTSHEYQEINCLPMNERESRPSRTQSVQQQHKLSPHRFSSPQFRSQSGNRLIRGNSALEPRHIGRLESPMRRSKSGDVSLMSEESQRRHGRRSNVRRSSERLVDPRLDPFFEPRLQEQDPRLIDPRFVDRRMFDPRFADPRLLDPRFLDPNIVDPLLLDAKMMDPRFLDPSFNDPRLIDPRFMEPPFLVDDPRLMRYPIDDHMQFPHLMTLPAGVPGPYSMPPLDHPNDYPHTMPRYNEFQSVQDSLLGPDLTAPLPPLDPSLQRFHPHFKDMNPLMNDPNMMPMPVPPNYPLAYPIDLPLPYPVDMIPMNYAPRERLNFERGRVVPRSRGSRHQPDLRNRNRKKDTMPPSSDDAKRTIHRIVRNSSKEDEDRDLREEINGNQRTNRRSQQIQSRRLTSTGHSDSSGRSSPLEGSNQLSRSRGTRYGEFRVGDPVRKDNERTRDLISKEIISLPHFTTGGKDSGFDEAPGIDDRNSNSAGRNPTPGFVVAGVFSDSSKMYIPAPPSPTPDYEEEVSDGCESDILHDSFYVKSPIKDKQENKAKTSSSSNRDSLSDDSLQERKDSGGTNSLQALMKEFHQGLPAVHPFEGSYSDDSLEEESSVMSPSGPNSVDLRSRRPQSLESLVSIDGSTTSFDYMSDLHSKFPSTSRLSNKAHKDKFRNSFEEQRQQLKSQKKNKVDPGKMKQPFKKAESLSSKSSSSNEENVNIRRNGSKSSSSSNEENEVFDKDSKTNSPNGHKKFNTIRTLIKEGRIEGLDETPPDFKPPPLDINPPTMLTKLARSSSNLEDRADSGLGSTVSTNHRLNDSAGSDDVSDKSNPSNHSDKSRLSNLMGKPRLTDKSISSKSSSVEKLRKTSSPPPLPPPRDSSITPTDSNLPLTRNQSWLYKNKRPAPLAPSSTDSMINKNTRPLPLRTSVSSKDLSTDLAARKIVSKKKKEKITHVDDINPSPLSNGNLASQYATPLDHKTETLDNGVYVENNKNQSSYRSYNDNLSLIYEDQASLSSHGSRSSRFFTRLTESMKSNRSSNASIKNKKNSTSKFFHGDVIRDPSLNRTDVKHKLKAPQFQSMIDAPIPLTRDGSGRFRSIEDLATVVDNRRGMNPRGGDDDLNKKKKKHSTLPPTLTTADMERHAKEFSKKGSQAIIGNRDENDGSKFKFNIFKGFWRRNKYSFDKY